MSLHRELPGFLIISGAVVIAPLIIYDKIRECIGEYVNSERAKERRRVLEEEDRLNCVCCVNDIAVVEFEECNHVAVCAACSEKIERCPMCRAEGERHLVYFP